MILALVFLWITVKARAVRQIRLEADDGLDAGFLGRVVKLNDAEHDAVIGDGQRRLAHLFGARDQLGNLAQPVEKRIFSMHVQVDKWVGHGRLVVQSHRQSVNWLFGQHVIATELAGDVREDYTTTLTGERASEKVLSQPGQMSNLKRAPWPDLRLGVLVWLEPDCAEIQRLIFVLALAAFGRRMV